MVTAMNAPSLYVMTLVTVTLATGAGKLEAEVQRVAWLQGCWEAASAERTIEEHWMAPRGTSMVGVGRTVRGADLVEYELVVIREQGEKLAYEAHPSGQPSAVFLSDTVSDDAVGPDLQQRPQRARLEQRHDDRARSSANSAAGHDRNRLPRTGAGGEGLHLVRFQAGLRADG
jgi:hypothetical protein